MIAVQVWLLLTMNTVHNGAVVIQQPAMYPTEKDCLQVLGNTPKLTFPRVYYRCIQTTVLVPK